MKTSNEKRYLDFIRKYNEVMREYEELLAETDLADNEIWALPPLLGRRSLVVERKCAFADESERYMEMLTQPGQRAAGLKELRNFSATTESLIVVDPYIYSGQAANAETIAQDFKKSIRAAGASLKRVHIIYDADESNTANAIRKRIHEMLADEKIHITEATSAVLHDRIWISDRSRATVIGTSLNGIGGRLAFILPLPSDDLIELLKYLDDNGLSRVAG